MTPERWQRVNEVFHATLTRPEHERKAFLSQACAGDTELRVEAESLLAAHGLSGSFINAPAFEAAAELLARAPACSLVGVQLGSYRILNQLGAGGMGEVYLAEDIRLGRQAALKLLPAAFTADPDRLRRFLREARATSALNHPNIVTIYEIGEAERLHFIATEYIEGQTLRQQMNIGPMELRAVLELAIQIASALAAAHNAGVVHRDIKPENIMVRPDGLLKVLDFGLAKLTHRAPAESARTRTEESVTSPGVVMGTFDYMSPEQARGQMVDARTDIFSLGVVMHEMITGQRPFDGETPSDVIAAILTYSPPPLCQCRADAPAELQRILNKTLCKDREERYQNSKELLDELQAFKQESEFRAKLADSGASVLGKADLQAVPDRTPAEKDASRTPPGNSSTLASVARHKWSLLLMASFLLVGGTAVALYSRGSFGGSSSVVPPRIVPLTTFDGREDYPSFSPDGNQLAFAWDGGGDNTDIYVKLIGAGAPLRLTTNPAEDSRPAWSPDGRYIAFTRYQGEENQIMLVPALGGAERKIGRATINTSGLAWSPDGKFLVTTDQGSPQSRFSLFQISIETLEKRNLTSPPPNFGDSQAAFSPDGRLLAFVRMSNLTNAAIYLLPMAGGEPKQLIADQRTINGMTWSADGREVIYSSNRTGSFNLWRLAITGSTPELIAAAGKGVYNPAISRQGNRLAYNERFLDSNIWRLEGPAASEGSGTGRRSLPTRLISSSRADHSPQYSPDGRKIVFVSDRSGNDEIWICDSDGLNPLQLTFFDGPSTGSPRWSPDGRHIVFDSRPASNPDIFVIAAEGGKPQALTTGPPFDMVPSWSHDGRWVYFRSNRNGSWQIWKVPVSGGAAVQVTQQGAFEALESPDGRLLYYTKGRGPGGIWQVPVEGGEEKPVPELSAAGYWRYWDVHSEGLYFLSQEAPAAPIIKLFSFATRHLTPIATPERAPLSDPVGLSISPDRKWILYAQTDQSISDLTLIENFR